MKDNKRPWFKFYPRDWLSDEKVRALSFRARGVYMEILCLMWKSRTCKLPGDKKRLSRMVGLPEDEFVKIWAELMHPEDPIFKIKKNKIQSDRLLLELSELKRIKKARSDAAKVRWDRALDAKACDLHIQSGMQNDDISDPESDPEPEPYIDNDLDKSAGAEFKKSGSRHYSAMVGRFSTIITDHCSTLNKLTKSNGVDFNPYQAVQMAVNQNAHPEAIVTVQVGMIKQWRHIKNPMGYWTKSIKCNSAKFNERDHIAQAEKFKQEWNLNPKLKKMVQGIGGKK